MKRTAFVFLIFAFASTFCHADELYIASNVMASSLDGLEFLLNGRPFLSGTVNKGSCSFAGPVSEWIKAGTNTLSVRVAERATEEMHASRKYPIRPDRARIRLNLGRRRNGKLVEHISIIDETFAILPTNFVFTVTDEWPIKKFVWEGETPTLTEKDKAEINELFDTCVGHAINMVDEYDAYLTLRTLIVEQEAMLKGVDVNEYIRFGSRAAKNLFRTGYSKKRPENKNIQYVTFPGINLVQITADNGKYGEKPIAVFSEDMLSSLNGPEWFSKINGKWCIVP